MSVINKRIHQFKELFNKHLLSTSGHKIPLNLYLSSNLKKSGHQEQHRSRDRASSHWQNVLLNTVRGSIVNLSIYVELSDETIYHVEHLKINH